MQELLAGQILSARFRLVRQLGAGGMGAVWLAEDQELKEQVALKILDPVLSQNPGFVNLLRDECSKARALVHPNIVRVFDFHTDNDRFYVSMGYVEGDTLATATSQPFQEIIRRALIICDALEYAHRAGVVHRDIKPGNVLCDRNGDCFLTDFGIAAAVSGEPDTGHSGGGSLPYMSPQQLARESATIADDIYSLGALLHELLNGVPLFHPDVTPERIRTEQVAPLLTDGADQAIPDQLAKLVVAMVDKAANRRPAGIGPVRLVLEEVLADHPAAVAASDSDQRAASSDDLIRPVVRGGRRAPGQGSSDTVTSAPRAPNQRGRGLSARTVYIGLGILVAAAVAVIFILPGVVRERGPVPGEQSNRETDVEIPANAGRDNSVTDVQRQLANEILGELLKIDDRMRAVGVVMWGGENFAEAVQFTETGDTAYRDGDFAAALTNYRQALTLMQLIEPRIAGELEMALQAGAAALNDGDQKNAVAGFELALAIDANSSTAKNGLLRALKLDQVVELTRTAMDAESAGNLSAAREAFASAVALDPDWQPAVSGLARTRETIATDTYQTIMATGFSALAAGDHAQARAAFRSALKVRPNDADALSALSQLAEDERLGQIVSIQERARQAEKQERWSEAVARYEEILTIDSNLMETGQDLQRSRMRLDLETGLNAEIAGYDRLNEDKIWQSARALVDRAGAVAGPGPILRGQIETLSQLLEIAAKPVPVSFQSDNLTEVVIYKVGTLGFFQNRTVDLRPGRYVAVGTREGFRDVRRSFNVEPDGNRQPIVLSCEDPI